MKNPIRTILLRNRISDGYFEKNICTEEEAESYIKYKKENGRLPEGVYGENTSEDNQIFYKLSAPVVSREEYQEYLATESANCLATIKKCCIFFVTLEILLIIYSLYIAFSAYYLY